MSDGEIFYHIRNGIRNTAMPAWNFPDRQVWQLVAYIRNLPIVAAREPQDIAAQQAAAVHGGALCRLQGLPELPPGDLCPLAEDARWPMSCAIPRSIPTPFAADLGHGRPDDRELHQGRYRLRLWQQLEAALFQEVGRHLCAAAGAMEYRHQEMVEISCRRHRDWWAQALSRSRGRQFRPPHRRRCATAAIRSITISTPSSPANGMSAARQCHGAGSDHVANPTRFNILNPARQNFVQANDTCIQCHSQGQPLTNPIKGKYYDWAVGYHAGLKLSDYLEAGRAQAGRDQLHPFPRRHRAQEPHAGQ